MARALHQLQGALESIERLLQALLDEARRPAITPEHQWVDIDGARSVLGMERRQFVDRIAPRPDFPRPARIDGKGRPRWKLAEVSAWMERHKGKDA